MKTIIVFAVCCISLVIGATVTVNTTDGPVVGNLLTSFKEFKGIPYAQPPARFAPPQAITVKRTTNYDATSYKSVCLQSGRGSENCLYLNIFVPTSATTSAAVFVWIHGGSYTSGAGSDYNGEFLSGSSNTIVVTINYRLGAFGFLALNELKTRDNTTGNYGHQDQRLAIRWVYNNIQFFGGDRTKITVAGESAGAHSVCSLVGDPKTLPYFRAAIIESTYSDCQIRSLSSAVSSGVSLASSFGCSGSGSTLLNCVLSANTSAILQSYASGSYYFTPTLDGTDLTQQPFTVISSGPKVPILVGTNLNEDATFHCTSEHVADRVAAAKPVYFYRFDYPPAQHASELAFLWGYSSRTDAGAVKLANNMKNYWISFTQSLIPTSTSTGAITWPLYTVSGGQYIILNSTLSTGQNYAC